MSATLGSVVSLHDIRDVERFVRSCIPKANLKPKNAEEREEILADGILLLYQLAKG